MTDDILINGAKVPFTFYDAAPQVPVCDIGDLFAKALDAGNHCTIGDTGDAFTVYMQNDTWASVLSLTFTSMSFAPVPDGAQAMQRLQYNRFHAVLMDIESLRQFSVPFNVPNDLLYDHERMAWGLRPHGYGGPLDQVMGAIKLLVNPVEAWMRVVKFRK